MKRVIVRNRQSNRVLLGHTNILLNPLCTSIFPSNLTNLEPFRLGRIELITCGRATRGHIGQHWTRIVRPLENEQ